MASDEVTRDGVAAKEEPDVDKGSQNEGLGAGLLELVDTRFGTERRHGHGQQERVDVVDAVRDGFQAFSRQEGQLLEAGFADSFRLLHPDEVKYSWWSYRFRARARNAGWRIDYFLVSKRVADKVRAAEIHNEVLGSDHCPVELDIDLDA